MARLPVVYDDADQWGHILNEFLRVAHNVDGSLKATAFGSFNANAVIFAGGDGITTSEDDFLYNRSTKALTVPSRITVTNGLVSAGSFENGEWNGVALERIKMASGVVFETGVRCAFQMPAAPIGWTRFVNAGLTDSVPILRTNGEVPSTGGSWTVSGLTNSAPTLTMNSYTPTGTVSQPTFTGTPLGSHGHATGLGLDNWGTATKVGIDNASQSGINITASKTFAITDLGAGGTYEAIGTSSTSAGTPAGTVSQPTFTGNAAVLTGSVSTPTISSNGSWRPKYVDYIVATRD